jgi:hypothetical protein
VIERKESSRINLLNQQNHPKIVVFRIAGQNSFDIPALSAFRKTLPSDRCGSGMVVGDRGSNIRRAC